MKEPSLESRNLRNYVRVHILSNWAGFGREFGAGFERFQLCFGEALKSRRFHGFGVFGGPLGRFLGVFGAFFGGWKNSFIPLTKPNIP